MKLFKFDNFSNASETYISVYVFGFNVAWFYNHNMKWVRFGEGIKGDLFYAKRKPCHRDFRAIEFGNWYIGRV